ncbi:MAG: hypothetical protein MUF87_22215 [Anaerolineae bacterium]|jgi:hypothetical protein|nr:hypothetical protein [Anaerolineae bacterium]
MIEKPKRGTGEKRKNDSLTGQWRVLMGIGVVILLLGVAVLAIRPLSSPTSESTADPVQREITREVIPTLTVETTAEPIRVP